MRREHTDHQPIPRLHVLYGSPQHDCREDVESAPDVLDVLRSGGTLPDEKLEALSRFTELMLEHRGRPNPDDLRESRLRQFWEENVEKVKAVRTQRNDSHV